MGKKTKILSCLVVGMLLISTVPVFVMAQGVSNGIAESKHIQEASAAEEFKSQAVATQSSLPGTIRVLRTATGDIEVVNFEEYVKNVLPNEWIASWDMDALKAGAMAVKTYAWYWTIHQKYPGGGYDVKDDISDQVYNPGSSHPRTDQAVEETWDWVMTKNDVIFESQYDSGTQGSPDPLNPGRMSQWGTQYWAEQGEDWQWMLHYYYDPVEIKGINTIAAVSTYNTILDDLDELVANGKIPGYDLYTDSNIDELWVNINQYKTLLIDEDCIFEWTNPCNPDCNKPIPTTTVGVSFYNHKAQLGQWIFNGGGFFSTDQNDVSHDIPVSEPWTADGNVWWTWLPDDLQVESNEYPSDYPEIGYGHYPYNLEVIYDPGIFSYPNVIDITKVDKSEAHGRFTQYPDYTAIVQDKSDGDVLEVYRTYGLGVVVLSHLEYETAHPWDVDYIENELHFVSLTIELVDPVVYDPVNDEIDIEVTKAYCPICGDLTPSNTVSAIYNVTDLTGMETGVNGIITDYNAGTNRWTATADVSSLGAGTYNVLVTFTDTGGHKGAGQAQFSKLIGSGIVGISTPNCLANDDVFIYATVKDQAENRDPSRKDVKVNITTPTSVIETLALYDNSTGVANGYDLNADDGEYSNWYKPTQAGTYTVDLYVGIDKMDTKSFTVITDPELIVLTDLPKLYNEFIDTGTAPDENIYMPVQNIIDFYELLDRINEYAGDHRGIVYSLGKEITTGNGYSHDYASLNYATSADDRKKMGELIDQFVYNINEETKTTSTITNYPLKYVAIIGDDEVVPFYRKGHPFLMNVEKDYVGPKGDNELGILNPSNPTLIDTSNGTILSDVPYMTRDTSVPCYPIGGPDPNIASGRIFTKHPNELINIIQKYESTVEIDDVAVFAMNPVSWYRIWNIIPYPHDIIIPDIIWDRDPNFPATAKGYVIATLDDHLSSSDIHSWIGDPYKGGLEQKWTENDFQNNISKCDLIYILSHACHWYQTDSSNGATITSNTYSSLPTTTEKKVVVSGGCHAGYSISYEGGNFGEYNLQLALGPMKQGIGYIGSTTYSVWQSLPFSTFPVWNYWDPYTSRMMKMYSEQLTTANTVGDAYKKAVKQYNILSSVVLSPHMEHTIYSQMLYGLPTQPLAHSGSSSATTATSTRSIYTSSTISSSPLSTAGMITPVEYSPDNVKITQTADDDTIYVSVDIPKFINTTVGNKTLFSVLGGTYAAEDCGFILPQIVVSRLLPAGSNVTNVSLTSSTSSLFPESVDLLESMPMLGTGKIINVTFVPTNPYPLEIYNATTTEWDGGILVILNIIPLQYNPQTKSVTLYDHLEFNISYTAPTPPVTLTVNYVTTDKTTYNTGENITVNISMTASASMNAGLGLEVKDQAGGIIYSYDELLNLPSGTSIVSRNIPTSTFSAGVKYLTTFVSDPSTGNVIYTNTTTLNIAGLYVTATLSKGMYSPSDEYANLTVEIRNETGNLIDGLQSSNFTVRVDGVPQTPTFTESQTGIYEASINISGLALGQHNISLTVQDNRGIQKSTVIYFGIGVPVSVPLYTGWNMISLPLQPSNLSASSVLQTIPNTAGNMLYIWNASKNAYDPIYGTMELEMGRAYWIPITANGTWTPSGTEVSGVKVNLTLGWSMIGISSKTSISPADINLTVGASTYNLIQAVQNGDIGGIMYSWNPVKNNWDATIVAASSILEPGKGYYLTVSRECMIIYP